MKKPKRASSRDRMPELAKVIVERGRTGETWSSIERAVGLSVYHSQAFSMWKYWASGADHAARDAARAAQEFWTPETERRFMELCRSGASWREIAPQMGVSVSCVSENWRRMARKDDLAARHEARLTRKRKARDPGPARVIEHTAKPAPAETFTGIVFNDDPHAATHEVGRAPMVTDPRYSLTPSSAA